VADDHDDAGGSLALPDATESRQWAVVESLGGVRIAVRSTDLGGALTNMDADGGGLLGAACVRLETKTPDDSTPFQS
jgi:hypothetical protein